MSVKIRLSKTGKTHQISYRIVVQDTRAKRDGRFLEILGFYNPYNKPNLRVDETKLGEWIKKGALPTEAVAKLLDSQNAKGLTTNAENKKINSALVVKR